MLFSRKILMILAVLTMLLVAGCSLAEDITPPPNYATPTVSPQQPVSASTVFPLVPPDPALGAPLFAQKCEPCHGATGKGDGSQAANLANPPAAIGSPELARQARPIDWFQMVTVGNLEKFMPGFTQSLSDRQRWDVVAYVYTLSATQQDLEQGKAAYTENCAACHGTSGKGDGPQAASLSTAPVSWDDQSRLTRLSADDIVSVMNGGKQGHPSLADKLVDDSQRYALATYIRSMSFAQSGQPAEANAPAAQVTAPAVETTPGTDSTPAADVTPDGTAAPAPTAITLSGTITNGTPGGKLPESGMQAQLRVFDGMNPAFEQSVDVAPDATFKFENVQYGENFVYLVQVTANGLTFNSDIVHATDIVDGRADMKVSIYDTSADTKVLRADRLHVFFDFGTPGKIQVVNLYIITNPTDQVVIGETTDSPVIQFDLPKGYENLQFQDGELGARYVQTETGFGDRMGIFPGVGQHQILFAYDMPYDKKLDLNIKVPVPVDAATVMMPPAGVNLKADQLTDIGKRDVQGTSYQMYQSAAAIEAGQTLKLSLSGKAGDAASAATTQNSTTYLLIGAGVFGLVLIGAGAWLYRQRAGNTELETAAVDVDGAEAEDSSDATLDAIVALDDLHASGKLPEEAYQERRAQLKTRLAEAMAREKAADQGK